MVLLLSRLQGLATIKEHRCMGTSDMQVMVLLFSPVDFKHEVTIKCFCFMQPFDFVVGEPVSQAGVAKINDSANGLFAGQAGVKPPPALSTAVIGMKTGGKVKCFPHLLYVSVTSQEVLLQC